MLGYSVVKEGRPLTEAKITIDLHWSHHQLTIKFCPTLHWQVSMVGEVSKHERLHSSFYDFLIKSR